MLPVHWRLSLHAAYFSEETHLDFLKKQKPHNSILISWNRGFAYTKNVKAIMAYLQGWEEGLAGIKSLQNFFWKQPLLSVLPVVLALSRSRLLAVSQVSLEALGESPPLIFPSVFGKQSHTMGFSERV